MSWNLQPTASILALLLTAAPTVAQEPTSEGRMAPPSRGLPSWVEQDPFSTSENDPLGIERSDQLERVAPTTIAEEAHRPIPVDHGPVLSAVAGVRETFHAMEVRLEHGLALVDVTMRFRSSARHAAEVRYRLAVPDRASLARLEVCNARGCRQGQVDDTEGPLGPYDDAVRSHAATDDPLPVAHAARFEDERGAAFRLRAAPVPSGRPNARRSAFAERLPEQRVPEGTLELRVRYVVDAPVRGGRVRLRFPERGRDDRAALASIRVRSDELRGGAVDGTDAVERPVQRAAWEPAEVSARLDGGTEGVRVEAWHVPCGADRCARLRAVAEPRPLRARDVILLLDVSPSMAGPPRGRLGPAAAAVLSALPNDARVRVAVFAARAEAVVEEASSPAEVSLAQVARSLERDLGSATRFEAAWALITPWVRRARDPLVLIVGDGGLTTGAEGTAAFRAARAAGAELAALNVADRPTTDELRRALEAVGGLPVEAGAEADRAAAGHGMDPLRERLAAILAPVVVPHVRARVGRRTLSLGALRAGEERVWEGAIGRGTAALLVPSGGPRRAHRSEEPPAALALAIRDRLLRRIDPRARPMRLAALAPTVPPETSTCQVRGTFRSASAAAPRGARLILAETRRCAPPSGENSAEVAAALAPSENLPQGLRPHEGPRSLPVASLLSMLRQRIIPVARGCFRDDRAGRASYQTRAVFHFRLRDREVQDASVEGRIDPELRSCLARALDGLEIPPFDGTIRVRYPIYTAPQLPPPTLTLDPAVADAVDTVAEEPE